MDRPFGVENPGIRGGKSCNVFINPSRPLLARSEYHAAPICYVHPAGPASWFGRRPAHRGHRRSAWRSPTPPARPCAWPGPSMKMICWIGGDLIVVQTGDQLDRGDEEQSILELLDRLQDEATAVGGAVHVLNGNHELMNARPDFRYVTEGGFEDFEDAVVIAEEDSLLLAYEPDQRARVAAFRPGGPFALMLAEAPRRSGSRGKCFRAWRRVAHAPGLRAGPLERRSARLAAGQGRAARIHPYQPEPDLDPQSIRTMSRPMTASNWPKFSNGWARRAWSWDTPFRTKGSGPCATAGCGASIRGFPITMATVSRFWKLLAIRYGFCGDSINGGRSCFKKSTAIWWASFNRTPGPIRCLSLRRSFLI